MAISRSFSLLARIPSLYSYGFAACAGACLLGCSGASGEPSGELPASPSTLTDSSAVETELSDTATVAAAPTPPPPASPGGGQTGGIGGDSVTYLSLGRDQVGPAGFSPAQAIDAFAGNYSAELIYASGERTTLRISVVPNGELVSVGEEPSARYVFQSWAVDTDNDSLSLGADVTFATDDGLFQEHGAYGLEVFTLESARTFAELPLTGLQGGYAAAAQVEGPSSAWVLPVVMLERTDAVRAMTGTLLAHLPDPEGGVDEYKDSILGTW